VDQPWRERAISKSLDAARIRAEKRLQRYLDAAFELIDERGTTDFTIQDIVNRSKQSTRGFYQYFRSKDELLLALFEENAREGAEDLRRVVDAESTPLDRLRAFTIRFFEWSDPANKRRKPGKHNRRPISEFSVHLAIKHPERVAVALAPVSTMLIDLLDEAVAAGAINVSDTTRVGALMEQTVMWTWLGVSVAQQPPVMITAEDAWEFCLNGLQPPSRRRSSPQQARRPQ
jgi:AcrR family transcriptional regulator